MFVCLFLAAQAHAMTLDEAWEKAASSSTARALAEQTAASDTLPAQVFSGILPHVDVQGTYTLNQTEVALDPSKFLPAGAPAGAAGDPIVIQQKDYFGASFTVVQPLFSGTAWPSYQASLASARSADAQQEARLDELRFGVARAYWAVVATREQVTLAGDRLEHAKSEAALVERRATLGGVEPTAALSAQIAAKQAERDLADAQAQQTAAEQNLSVLIGIDPATPLDKPQPRAIPYSDVDAAIARAQGGPAVTAADERASAAQRVKTTTDLGWVPTVNGRFSELYSQNTGFSGKNWNWQVGVTADWTFDGGYRLAKEREAGHQAAAADIAATRERDQAAADVRGAWASIDAARHAHDLAAEQLGLAEESLRKAEKAYEVGSLAFIDLDSARKMRDGAALGVLSADMQLDLSVDALLARTGDL